MRSNIYIDDKVFSVDSDDFYTLVWNKDEVWSTDFELPLTGDFVQLFNILSPYDLTSSEVPCKLQIGLIYMDATLYINELDIENNVLKCWIKGKNTGRFKTDATILDDYLPDADAVTDGIADKTLLPVYTGEFYRNDNISYYHPYMMHMSRTLYDYAIQMGYSVIDDNALSQKLYVTSNGFHLDKRCRHEKVVFGEELLNKSHTAGGFYGGWTDESVSIVRRTVPWDNTTKYSSRISNQKTFTTSASTRSFKINGHMILPSMNPGSVNPWDYDTLASEVYGSVSSFEDYMYSENYLKFQPNVLTITSDRYFSARPTWGQMIRASRFTDSSTNTEVYVCNINLRLQNRVNTFYDGSKTYSEVLDMMKQAFSSEDYIIVYTEDSYNISATQTFTIYTDVWLPDHLTQNYLVWYSVFIESDDEGVRQYPSGNVEHTLSGPGGLELMENLKITGLTARNTHHFAWENGGVGYDGSFVLDDCPNYTSQQGGVYDDTRYMQLKSLTPATYEVQAGNHNLQELCDAISKVYNFEYSIDEMSKTFHVGGEDETASFNIRPLTVRSLYEENPLESINLYDGLHNFFPEDYIYNNKDENSVKTEALLLNRSTVLTMPNNVGLTLYYPMATLTEGWVPFEILGVEDVPVTTEIVYNEEKGEGLCVFLKDTVELIERYFPMKEYVQGWVIGDIRYMTFNSDEDFNIGAKIALNTYSMIITEKEMNNGLIKYTGRLLPYSNPLATT